MQLAEERANRRAGEIRWAKCLWRDARGGGGVLKELREIALVRAHRVFRRVAVESEKAQELGEVLGHGALIVRQAQDERRHVPAGGGRVDQRALATTSSSPDRQAQARTARCSAAPAARRTSQRLQNPKRDVRRL